MGFEAPLALLALAAAGLPILVHLMRRRDLPIVTLPTIALLRRADAQSASRMRLVDLLLLACRVAMFTLAALAVAAPFLLVSPLEGDGRAASLAIVIDDSMSMTRATGQGTALERAKERAIELVASLPEGSEIAVVLAGKPARVLVARTNSVESARSAIEGISAQSARGTDVSHAVARATRELGGARLARRRLSVLTDRASHAHLDEVVWPHDDDIVTSLEDMAAVDERDSYAVTSVTATPDPTTRGRASVRAELRAYGSGEGTVQVELRARGRVLDTTSATFERGAATATLHGGIDPEDPRAEIVLGSHDSLATDDRRGVLLRPPSARRVLLVDGDPHPGREDDELGFVVRALELAPSSEGAIVYRVVDESSIASSDLADVDVVVLANVTSPAPSLVSRLETLVARGGGLLVAAGDHVDGRRYAERFGDLLPARMGLAIESATPVSLRVREGAEIMPPGDAGLSLVETRKRVPLEATSPDTRVELEASDGTPMLVTGRHGEGRVAVLGTTLDDDWSDLPYRPGFLPLVVALTRALAPPGAMPDTPFPAGEAVHLELPPGATRAEVTAPDGSIERCDAASGCALRATALPGAYRVDVGGGSGLEPAPRLAFVVAPPSDESDPAPSTFELAAPDDDSDAHAGAYAKRPLAQALFLVFGLLALLEALLRAPLRLRGHVPHP